MNSLAIFAIQEAEKSKASKLGYEIGYFVGSNFWEVVIFAVVLLVAILFLLFYRKSDRNMS